MYGERLTKIREERSLTQQDITNLLKLNSNAYAQYEREDVTIPIKHLNTLCNYFDVSFDYIFSFTDVKSNINLKENINEKIVGERLKKFRKDNKLTQVKLASILNTTHSVIADYERGRYIISTSFLYAICKNFGVSADYLLGKKD